MQNAKCKIQRHRTKTNKTKNATQKTEKINNTGTTQKPRYEHMWSWQGVKYKGQSFLSWKIIPLFYFKFVLVSKQIHAAE